MTGKDYVKTKKHAEALTTFAIEMQNPKFYNNWTAEGILQLLQYVCHEEKVKMPVFYELFTGHKSAWPLNEVLAVAGWEWTLNRIFALETYSAMRYNLSRGGDTYGK